MNSPWVDYVLRFHQKFGHPIGEKGRVPSKLEKCMRTAILAEEVCEYFDALAKDDRAEILDALADIIFVAIGTAITYGFDIDEAMRRVYASNMSKLGPDGLPIYREDGKVVKGENYFPPKFDDLI